MAKETNQDNAQDNTQTENGNNTNAGRIGTSITPEGEMTANVLGPVCILIYLFVLDWRMALLSLVSIPVGPVLHGWRSWPADGKQYEARSKTTQA